MSGAGTAAAERAAATPARDRRKAKAAAAWRRRGRVLLFLSPWLIGFAIFIAIPLVVTIGLSFTRYDLLGDPTWVGASNYERLLFTDRQIWPAIGNTLWFVVVSVPLRVVFALGIEIMLARAHRGVGIYRTIFYLPALAPPVAATLGFVYLLNSGNGPGEHVPREAGHRGTPLVPVAGLVEGLPRGPRGLGTRERDDHLPRGRPRRAAAPAGIRDLDGAGRWQRFRWVTLPSISPVVLFIIVIGVIEGLQYFTQAYIAATVAAGQASQAGDSNTLELGYPQGSTLFYPILLYQNGFRNFQMGYVLAMAIVLLIVAFTLTVIILRNSRRWVHYGGSAR